MSCGKEKKMKKLIYAFSLVFLLASMIVLIGCKKEEIDPNNNNVAVSAIIVSGAEDFSAIKIKGGTLQMSVTVLPSNASNNEVVWSVINKTGTATINSTGVLKAITNGTVIVSAESISNPSISNSKTITITNQTPVNMDATLTNLTVNDVTVMGFSPTIEDYVMVLTNGVTVTPVTVATTYQSTAKIVITSAIDVNSTDAVKRTTTIVVTSEDTLNTKTYKIEFRSSTKSVDLKSANDFVILAKTGISTATTSDITGDMGISPAPATYITGFSLTIDSTGLFSRSEQVTGKIYASDYTTPTPTNLTTAISDMQTAYIDASSRAVDYNELYAGDLSGKTLTIGVYKYGNSVLINETLTLTGSATDVWIFQIAGSLTQASGKNIILAGGALAKNIIWQVADTVTIGTDAHFEGTVLAKTNIRVNTNASINGQLYAQTAVTLDNNIIVKYN